MKNIKDLLINFGLGLTLLVIFLVVNAFDKDFGAHE